ncbi:diguanylate cyclase [Shewanella eurypsychrophilus]|uniref:diguanylate cyclase n=1 Tax=Shewanella eurypsychrophilus TaxID=2593656 RepID=A0ABX6VDR7_9GAMM|nr:MULTISPECIES: GGDEF domain-containing protein [Shewanella]QFU23574.1 diguanylate cyclase [Shewanella sp. YLB-09]QPG60506.2 diguanylate cyclase [Shewanella eurypsychrophilus]
MNKFSLLLVIAVTFISFGVTANNYNSQLDELEQSLLNKPELSKAKINKLVQLTADMTSEQIARLLTLRSIKLIFEGDYAKSIDLLSEAENRNPSHSLMNSIYLYKATSYISSKKYKLGLQEISKNLARIERIDDKEILSDTYQRLANLYLEVEAYDEMDYYAKLSIELSHNSNAKSYCYALLLVAVADLKLGALDEAKNSFNNSLDFCETNDIPLIAAMSTKGLGDVELKKNSFDDAKTFLLSALNQYERFHFQIEINSIHALLSETYFGLNDNQQAYHYAELVMKLPYNPSNLEFKQIASKVLSKLSYQEKDFKQAYDYLSLQQALSKTLLDDTKAKANAYQMAKFENGEKNREINLLNKDRELYTAKAALIQSQRNNERMMNTLIVGGLVLLGIFAGVMTLQRRKYKKLAQNDALTGILNRGTAQNIAEVSYIKSFSLGTSFSIVMFDLDLFKRINDEFGHGTGDWVLKKVSDEISKICPSSTIFARFGGEEFALFLPGTSESSALDFAEQCRAVISQIDTKYSGHTFKLSASFGVTCSAEGDLSLDPMLHRADIAMYHSKEHGRNRVTRYSPEIEKCRAGYQKSRLALN